MSEEVSIDVHESGEICEQTTYDASQDKFEDQQGTEVCEPEAGDVYQPESEETQNKYDDKIESAVKSEKDASNENSEELVQGTKNQSYVSLSEYKEGDSLVEDKDLIWDSRWAEHYASIDDDKPAEDFDKIGDPKKLILWAAEKNELETLRKLLEEDPSLVNVKDNDLYTPLHRAAYSNNVEVIRLLLSYDADVSAKTTDGWEPLHCACKWDSVEAVSLLLQNGADVNAETKGHLTPLHLAASNTYGRRTLELLLWHPYVDPNIKNDAGDTPYDIAYRTGPLGSLFEMLEESLNVY